MVTVEWECGVLLRLMAAVVDMAVAAMFMEAVKVHTAQVLPNMLGKVVAMGALLLVMDQGVQVQEMVLIVVVMEIRMLVRDMEIPRGDQLQLMPSTQRRLDLEELELGLLV